MSTVTVMNVFPHDVHSQYEYGRWGIVAADEKKGYSLRAIENTLDENGFGAANSRVAAGYDEDRGEPKFFMRPIQAQEIAENLVRDHSKVGVRIIAGEAPTEEEFEAAMEQLEVFYVAQVKEADKLWIRYKEQPGVIQDMHRESAKYLQQKGHSIMSEPKGWMMTTVGAGPQQDCPGCGEMIKVGVAICKHCKSILDRDKAIELGIIKPPHGGTARAGIPKGAGPGNRRETNKERQARRAEEGRTLETHAVPDDTEENAVVVDGQIIATHRGSIEPEDTEGSGESVAVGAQEEE